MRRDTHPLTDDHSFAGAFAAGLLAPDMAVPDVILAASAARYAVYRNNITVSLIEALAATFPATKRIVGDDFFRAMARTHIRACPPRSPLLFHYGSAFAAFIDTYPPASGMPWLADVARIERAWLDAYHAAEAGTLSAQDFARVDPARLGDIVLTPHPAARVLSSAYPAVSIFSANRKDEPVGRIAAREGEDALITRPGADVIVRLLPPGGAIFLRTLMDGEDLATAAGAALASQNSFDLALNLAGLIETGAFSTLAFGSPSDDARQHDDA